MQNSKSKIQGDLRLQGDKEYWNEELNNFDFLLFGPESVGLPDEIREKYLNLTIPMKERSRSINLANSVSIVMFEAIRQANVK